ncbi:MULTISPECIES: hypothetical protein [Streptomyces]|nr:MULTISPECIES: hypothetical protein [Streptomyces]OOV30625.1 hypothetical protein SM007_15490 [Streptomyces avermitilis]
MPNPQPLTCQTCGSREMHEPLTPDEKAWLRGQLGNPIGDNYYKCVNRLSDEKICRNLRTHGHEKHFRDTKRLPDKLE